MQQLTKYSQIKEFKWFNESMLSDNYEYNLLEADDWINNIQPREPNTHKYHYGKVVVIAGSMAMAGAAALVSNAAITAGAGLVYLYSTTLHYATKPEIIFHKLKSTNSGTISDANKDTCMNACKSANVIIIGPGLRRHSRIKHFVRELVLENLDKMIVIDADAISCFNSNDILSPNITLTPHTGELSSLIRVDDNLNKMYENLEINKMMLAKTIAEKMNCNILLKGPITFIASPNRMFINTFGNAGMATAGSGDVLSGLIGGVLARNYLYLAEHTIDINIFVALASLLHSQAGDKFVSIYNMESLTASDLIETISKMKY